MKKQRAGKRRESNRLARWWRDVRAELRRVVWPTPKETYNLTLVVIVLSVMMGVLMFLFDTLFAKLYELLTKLL